VFYGKSLTYTHVYIIIKAEFENYYRLIIKTEAITVGKNYSAQEKHIRKNYARFPLDLRPETLEEFKKVCKENGTTPTTEIKKFIASYCETAREK
jgi:hypothetical protein